MINLPEFSSVERMLGEYRTLGVHPGGYLMARVRPYLPKEVIAAAALSSLPEGEPVVVAGLVIRRQRPLGKTVFITLEDETGHIPLVVWPKVYQRYKHELASPLVLAAGTVSRREGSFNIVIATAEALSWPDHEMAAALPSSRDFH